MRDLPDPPVSRRGRPPGSTTANVERRRARIRRMLEDGLGVREIAAREVVSEAVVRHDMRLLGVSAKRAPRGECKASAARERRAAEGAAKVEKIRDRRRFKVGPVATGVPASTAPAGTAGTQFPGRVTMPGARDRVLVDGASNAKIGGDVLLGRLAGARIFTLTLEERATCPRSCQHWRTCYGNSMPWPRRWVAGPALESALRREVAELSAAHDRILVRLHVLGDFYSTQYVDLWGELLRDHDGLNVFGFTAWGDQTEIGARVAAVRNRLPDRFMVRHSGRTGRWGSFTIDWPTELPRLGDAVVCPEQRDANLGGPRRVHCGSCAVCWQTDLPIVFTVH